MKRQRHKNVVFKEAKLHDMSMDSENISTDCDQSDRTGREITRKAAFTLIELIVVMAVIGILVLLAAPKFLGYTQRAQETKHIHTAKVIETALEAYLIHGGEFPTDLEVVDPTLLSDAVTGKTLIGVDGYVSTLDGETYYELTHDFIKKLDVKLSAKAETSKLFIEALAESIPNAIYSSNKGITLIDKNKQLKGFSVTSPGKEGGDNEVDTEPEVPETPEVPPPYSGNVVQLASGDSHTLVLMNDGTVKGWGLNSSGQLGDSKVVSITSGHVNTLISNVKQIATGKTSSLVLLTDGTVYSFGTNLGRTGTGTTPGKISELTNIVQIAAGPDYSMALRSDGRVYTWGKNNDGQLATGSTYDDKSRPYLTALTGVVYIDAGARHAAAIKSDGSVWTWGYNGYGQLGLGNIVSKNNPTKVPGLSNIEKVSLGQEHSIALQADGKAYIWGRNVRGQIGDNTQITRLSPVNVAIDAKIKDIKAGYLHTIALLEDGSLMTWGDNFTGQLGLNNPSQYIFDVPTAVPGLSNVHSIEANELSTFAILNKGEIYGWGNNVDGKLGDGTNINRISPTANISLQ